MQAMQERIAHLEDQLSEMTQQLDSSEAQLQVTEMRFWEEVFTLLSFLPVSHPSLSFEIT